MLDANAAKCEDRAVEEDADQGNSQQTNFTFFSRSARAVGNDGAILHC
jgi:hypothetical protein